MSSATQQPASLGGKGAVVTGGSRGIGRAIVQRLAAEGATVVFNFARSVDQAAEVERVVRDAGGRAHAVQIDLATSGAVDVASKGAIEQLTQVAALELGGRGITVNVICPGAIDTELLRERNPEADLEQVAHQTPLGRLGQPNDIADVVALLAGHDGRWLTGQIIHATGGLFT